MRAITNFNNISGYPNTKGAIESLAKSINIEYADSNITFLISHSPFDENGFCSINNG